MRSLVVLLGLLALILGLACAKEQVLTLDDSNFKNLLEQHEWIVLLMYTPWHRRSTQMLFEFNSLKQLVGDDVSHQYQLARVDCQIQRAACTHFHEFQYPTIRLLRRNFPAVIYQSFWDIKYVAKWIRRYITALERIDGTREEFLRFTSAPRYALAVFKERGADYLEYSKLAFHLCHEYPEYSFGYMMYEDALMEGMFSAEPPWTRTRAERLIFEDAWQTPTTLIVQTERSLFLYSRTLGDSFQYQDMDTFMFSHTEAPLFPHLDRATLIRYLDYGHPLDSLHPSPPRPALIYFSDHKDPWQTSKLNILRSVAFSLTGRINVVYTDRSHLQHMIQKLQPNDFSEFLTWDDVLILVYPGRQQHWIYPVDSALALSAVTNWALNIVSSAPQPSTMNAGAPTSPNTKSKVLRLGYVDFEQRRQQPNWPAHLVFLTDTVCGFCKRLAPVVDEVASHMQQSHPNIPVVEYDIRRNTLPFDKHKLFGKAPNNQAQQDSLTAELVVTLPQLILIFDNATTRSPVIYDGPRTVAAIVAFVESSF